MERPEHGHDPTIAPAAPGDLELVRGFLSLHEHAGDRLHSLPPSTSTLEWWFRSHGLLRDGEPAPEDDLAWAATIQDDLRGKVTRDGEHPVDRGSAERLNEAARESGIEIRFAEGGGSGFESRATGIRGAIGRLLGIAFLAELDGTWSNLKTCGSHACRSVFYDRSKNRSGKWCSMQTCGNRAKVRAFRERNPTGS
ncbi:MAG TPA: CGNR zinc finger domain-containing protein [Actinomycetota bacterium]